MAIHANSTPAPERLLLRDVAAPGRLLPASHLTPDRESQLLAILNAGPLEPAALAVLSRSQRRRAQAGIDALIDYLDAVTPDADLEPSLGFALRPGELDEVEAMDEDGDDNGLADMDGLCEQVPAWDGRAPLSYGGYVA